MRLLQMAKRMSELPPQSLTATETAVHIRDLKTTLKRLLEYIESLPKPDQK